MSAAGLLVTIDPAAAPLSETIARAAAVVPFAVLTSQMYENLVLELGGDEPAVQRLLEIAEAIGRPIGVNLLTWDGSSSTWIIAPRHWSSERIMGWTAAKIEALDAMFGTSSIRETTP